MRQSGPRVAIISVLLLGLLIFGGVYYAWNTATAIFQPVESGPGKTVSITIMQQQTADDIADVLQEKGLIKNAIAFKVWARIKGLDTRLQAGVYGNLNTSMTINEIIDELLNAQPDAVTVTIPEGWRLEQIGQKYTTAGLVKFKLEDFQKYTKKLSDFPDAGKYPFLKEVPQDKPLEGLLFPDTYNVPIEADALFVVNMMVKRMGDIVEDNNLVQLAKDHQLTFYEMLIIASIVERETLLPKDGPQIASVYWNRFKKPNDETVGFLHADPTVQYGRDTLEKPEKYWEPLNNVGAEVAPDSPWNTYVKKGLPPTPICSPGLASLMSAANPPPTDFYFFFAKKDKESVFAKTFAEFEQKKQEFGVSGQ